MYTRTAIALLAGTLLSTAAYAQGATPGADQLGTMQQNQGVQMNQGAAGAAQSANIQYVRENRPDLWRASRLEGINVYNQNNERVGDISEVLVNRQGEVEAVVIGVGGFLGIGERSVAVPFSALQWQQEPALTADAAGTMAQQPVDQQQAAAPPAGTAADDVPATTGATGATGNMTGGTGVGAGTPTASAGDQMRDYPERAILPNATREQLEQAPEFRFAN